MTPAEARDLSNELRHEDGYVSVPFRRKTENTILLGMNVGSADTEDGSHIELIASGDKLEIHISRDGKSATWTADLKPLAEAALAESEGVV